MKILTSFFLVMATVLLIPVSQAEELNRQAVEHWLQAMPKLTDWLSQHEEQLDADDVMAKSEDMEQVFSRGVEQLRKQGLYNDFRKQVNQQGYKSVEQWADTSRDITMAYMAIEMESETVNISQMKAQLNQLQAAEGIPAEQKVMMEQMLKASLMMVQAANNVPAANKSAVRPYLQQIRQSMDEQNTDSHLD